MENVKNEIKIPAIIALVLQGVTVSSELLAVMLQKQLVPLFSAGMDAAKMAWVFPPSIFLEILTLVLYIVFVYLIFSGRDIRRRPAGIALAAVNIAIISMSYPTSYIFTFIVSRFYGVEQLVMASSIQNMFAIVNAVFGIAASPLFFIACGRYGVSENRH